MELEQTADFHVEIEGKATVLEDGGDLYIEGYASDYGVDRQDEAFEPGAFDQAITDFMKNPALIYHHDFAKSLGVVEALERRDEGLWMRARVDKPAAGSWAEDVYNKIKRGSIKGLSVGGRFHRRLSPSGPRIHRADLVEISVTPTPVNPRTLFAVAGKAFESKPELGVYTPEETADLTATLERISSVFDDALQRMAQHPVK